MERKVKLEIAGVLRPQPGGCGGTVYGLGGTAGANVEGPTVSSAQTAASVAAKNLGWSPPYRWEGPFEDDTYILRAVDDMTGLETVDAEPPPDV